MFDTKALFDSNNKGEFDSVNGGVEAALGKPPHLNFEPFPSTCKCHGSCIFWTKLSYESNLHSICFLSYSHVPRHLDVKYLLSWNYTMFFLTSYVAGSMDCS